MAGRRIGDSLDTFVRDWGRRGVCRGGVVVICSDGLDRGDPAVLSVAMERLSRLSHRVVWMNPHKGDSVAFQAEHARDDGGCSAHRPDAFRPRSEQLGSVRHAAAEAELGVAGEMERRPRGGGWPVDVP